MQVSLKTVPNGDPIPEEIEELLANKSNLEQYQKFTTEFGYLNNPHTYSKHQIDHLNLLSMPWLLPERSLRRFTGLTLLDFWRMTEQLAVSGTIVLFIQILVYRSCHINMIFHASIYVLRC